MKSILLLAVFFSSLPLSAAKFRIRAREHFEWLDIKYSQANDASASYFGLTNTINIGFEKPFHYLIGLGVGPVLGSAKIRGDATPPTGTDEKVRLWILGFEGKYFFFPEELGLFGRVGLHANLLDTRGDIGTLFGMGYYMGVGYEFKVWKLGIAPELAFRHVFLESGSRLLAFTTSIGIHFYNFLGDVD